MSVLCLENFTRKRQVHEDVFVRQHDSYIRFYVEGVEHLQVIIGFGENLYSFWIGFCFDIYWTFQKNYRYTRIMASSASTGAGKKHIQIDVSSDNVCPWCFVGKKNLDKAIAASKDQYDFEVLLSLSPFPSSSSVSHL